MWNENGINTYLTGFVRIITYSADTTTTFTPEHLFEIFEGEMVFAQKQDFGRRINGLENTSFLGYFGGYWDHTKGGTGVLFADGAYKYSGYFWGG